MIRIPFEEDRLEDGTHPGAEVTAVEGTILLSIDLDPRSAFLSWRRQAEGVQAVLDGFLKTPGRLSRADAGLLVDEVLRLGERLNSVVPEVEAHLRSEEARNLAAALAHYARETEKGRI